MCILFDTLKKTKNKLLAQNYSWSVFVNVTFYLKSMPQHDCIKT